MMELIFFKIKQIHDWILNIELTQVNISSGLVELTSPEYSTLYLKSFFFLPYFLKLFRVLTISCVGEFRVGIFVF
jgi:hypothetical protein